MKGVKEEERGGDYSGSQSVFKIYGFESVVGKYNTPEDSKEGNDEMRRVVEGWEGECFGDPKIHGPMGGGVVGERSDERRRQYSKTGTEDKNEQCDKAFVLFFEEKSDEGVGKEDKNRDADDTKKVKSEGWGEVKNSCEYSDDVPKDGKWK